MNIFTYGIEDGDVAASSKTESESKKTKEELLASLSDIEKKYGLNTVEAAPLNLEKVSYDAPSDSDIAEQAAAELTAKKIAGENAINTDTDKKINDYVEYKAQEEKSADELMKALDESYAERKTAAENEALKRGLARSSIIMNKIEDFDKGVIEGKSQIQKELAEKINKFDYSINALSTEREKALTDFDIQHAADITKKINELKNEREKNVNEALKYNNTVTEKEAKHMSDALASQQKATEEYLKNKDKYDQLIMTEKLAAVKSYYDAMPPEEALKDFLKDSTMLNALKDYYSYMHVYLKSRAGK